METELTYCELKRREVINGCDGSRMGHILDLVFCADSGKIKGVILPYGKRGIFQKSQDLFVPWSCIQKIGEDVIIVEINGLNSGSPKCISPPPEVLPGKKKPPHDGGRDCDGKCEKCMLFECDKRWEGTSA